MITWIGDKAQLENFLHSPTIFISIWVPTPSSHHYQQELRRQRFRAEGEVFLYICENEINREQSWTLKKRLEVSQLMCPIEIV